MTWPILWVGTAVTIGLPLATIDRPLKVSVSQIPGLLAPVKPIINCGHVSGLTRPRKQGWLESEDTLERSQARGVFPDGILSVFRPHQVPAPVPLMELTVGSEETGDLLVESFDLTVGLRMVAGGKAHVDLEHLEESRPNSGRELRTPVRHNVFGQTIKTENQVTEVFSGL